MRPLKRRCGCPMKWPPSSLRSSAESRSHSSESSLLFPGGILSSAGSLTPSTASSHRTRPRGTLGTTRCCTSSGKNSIASRTNSDHSRTSSHRGSVDRAKHAGDAMRLTPAQIDMYALLGHRLPFCFPVEWSLTGIIRHGREWLARLAGVDFGYDPVAWHEHLSVTAGGYRWDNKHRRMPREIARATSDPAWLAAVAELQAAEGMRGG